MADAEGPPLDEILWRSDLIARGELGSVHENTGQYILHNVRNGCSPFLIIRLSYSTLLFRAVALLRSHIQQCNRLHPKYTCQSSSGRNEKKL